MGDLVRDSEPLLHAAARGMAVAHWAGSFPDRPALISSRGVLSFSQLNGRANQLLRALRRRGLRAGDAVALLCGNRSEFVEVWAACQRGGLRLTPINWHLGRDEAAYIVADCEAKALILDSPADAEAVSSVDTHLVRLSLDGEGDLSYAAALAAELPTDITDPQLGSSMLYTSGTTGRPKGVHRPPQSEIVSGAYKAYGYCHGDVHLCTGPLYHAAPLNMSMATPLSSGVGVVLMEQWDAASALRCIAEHRVTHTHMVPTMFHRLLALPCEVREASDLSSLRVVLHGAAPCPPQVKRAMIEWLGPIVYEYYAATEGPGTVVDSLTWLERPGTVGKPMPAGQVMVGDEDGRPVGPGVTGQVWLRAPSESRFQYFKDNEKTSGAFRGEYFTLGDIGHLDADGFLFLTDRSANLIISGGVNIYPAEVDGVLLEHPAVADAATIGVPDEEWGEQVKAVVELKVGLSGSDELATELIDHCRARLAHYKCPRSVDFVEALPRQDNGKIYKRLLRDRYRA